MPNARRVAHTKELVSEYCSKNSPISTRSNKVAEIASVKATTGKVTITLKKALTKEQILAIKASGVNDNENVKSKDKVAYFSIFLTNKSNFSDRCQGLAKAKAGSKTITVTPRNFVYDSKECQYVWRKVKLKKGKTYMLGSISDWTKGKTVKVK